MTQQEIVSQLFAEMARQRISVTKMQEMSGVNRQTQYAWKRGDHGTTLLSIIPALDAVGLELVVRRKPGEKSHAENSGGD